jgi:DNA (cytosine-5)-methyltransferase 1
MWQSGVGGSFDEDGMGTLVKNQTPAVAFMGGQGSRARGLAIGDKSPPLKSAPSGGNTVPTLLQSMSVRRLLPVECEKLQGFPDNFTAIQYKGKPAADGQRYKALGNSMAVPVVEYILRRIEMML